MKAYMTVVTGHYVSFNGRGQIFRKEIPLDKGRAEAEKQSWMERVIKQQEEEGTLNAISIDGAKATVISFDLVE